MYDIGFSLKSALNTALNPLEHLKMTNKVAQAALSVPGRAVNLALTAPQRLVNRLTGRRGAPAAPAALTPRAYPPGMDPSMMDPSMMDPSMMDPSMMDPYAAMDPSMMMDPSMQYDPTMMMYCAMQYPPGFNPADNAIALSQGGGQLPPGYMPGVNMAPGLSPFPPPVPAPGQPGAFVPTGPGVVRLSGCDYDLGATLDSLQKIQNVAVAILKDPLTRKVARDLAQRTPYGKAAVAIVDALPQVQQLAKMAVANAITDPKVANAAAILAEAKTGVPQAVVKLALVKKAAELGQPQAVQCMQRVEAVNQATKRYVGQPVETAEEVCADFIDSDVLTDEEILLMSFEDQDQDFFLDGCE